MDSLFQKNLPDLVKGLRVTMVGEGRYLAQAMADVRREIKFNDPHVKTVALQKLMYIQMLQGLDVSWAAFNVIEVMSLPRFSHRQVGYQAASQFFNDDTDVMLLITNLLRKDLASPNQYEAGMALNCLASIVTPDLARELLADVLGLLNSGRPYLKKKAAAALVHFVRRYPDCLRMTIRRLTERMDDSDISVKCAAVSTLCEMAVCDPAPYLPLAPDLYQMLISSSNTWLVIKLVKIFGILAPLESRLGRKLADPLHAILTKTQARSLIFECVRTITVALPNHVGLVKVCVLKLREFLGSGDQNLKYLGLRALSHLMPQHVAVIAPYKDSVLGCLDRLDPCVQRMSLSLLTAMVSESSLRDTVRVLLRFMRSADGGLRDDLVSSILSMCGRDHYRMLHDFGWYVAVLVDLAKIPESIHGHEVARQWVEIILRVEGVRAEAVNQLRSLLIDPVLLGGPPKHPTVHHVLAAAAWATGEYAPHVADHRQMLEALLQPRVKLLPARVQAVYLQAILKIYVYASTRNDRMLYVAPSRSPRGRSRSNQGQRGGTPNSPRSRKSPYGSGGSNLPKLPLTVASESPSSSSSPASAVVSDGSSNLQPKSAALPATTEKGSTVGGNIPVGRGSGNGSSVTDAPSSTPLEPSSETAAESQQDMSNLPDNDVPENVLERGGQGSDGGARAVSVGSDTEPTGDDVAVETSLSEKQLRSPSLSSPPPVAVGKGALPSRDRSGSGLAMAKNERERQKRGSGSGSGIAGGGRDVSGHRRGPNSGWDRTEVDGLGYLIRAHIDMFSESVDLEVRERLGNLTSVLDHLGVPDSGAVIPVEEWNTAANQARTSADHRQLFSEGRYILLTMCRVFREEQMVAVSRNAQKRVAVPDCLVLEESLDSLDEVLGTEENERKAGCRYGVWEGDETGTITFRERRPKQAGNPAVAAAAKLQLDEHRQKNEIYYLSSPSSSSKKSYSSSSVEDLRDEAYPAAELSESLKRMSEDSGNTGEARALSEVSRSSARGERTTVGEVPSRRKGVKKLIVNLDGGGGDDVAHALEGVQAEGNLPTTARGSMHNHDAVSETERRTKDEGQKGHRKCGTNRKGVRSSGAQQKANKKKASMEKGEAETRLVTPQNCEHEDYRQSCQENGGDEWQQGGVHEAIEQLLDGENIGRPKEEVPLIDLNG
ncbi:hypothetical protein CBR_g44606 [Chara braunii]|uniref:AP-3 complex subunit delta n=1 Tax=Chara braunii TaxID=69332 RepID=A0A388LXU5_CHABU|nr:hypothetical protein CBR_g44606 [Chara braunii]|eukprot:GBG87148.1 hypothetical protein CBR_g44606 [Chara braunii]